MVVGAVKRHTVRVINKKIVERDGFGAGLEGVTDIALLKEEVKHLIDGKGRVYGLYGKKKNLVAIYLFDRVDDFFIENGGSEVQIIGKKMDISDKWFGESKAALRFVISYFADVPDENRTAFEEAIQSDLKDQIELGQIGGVQWGESILYRKNIDKSGGNGYWMGYILGAMAGFLFGWVLFDNIGTAICFAVSYALLGGIIFSPASKDKDRWNKIDLDSLSDTAKEMFNADFDYNNIGETDSSRDFINLKYRRNDTDAEGDKG